MTISVAQQLEKLDIKVPVVQTSAVEELFSSIRSGSLSISEARSAATSCLRHESGVVVEAAVDQLFESQPSEDALGLLRKESSDLLLTSLSSGAKHEGPLVHGILLFFVQATLAGTVAPAWAKHPLSKALVATRGSHAHLLEEIVHLLATLQRHDGRQQRILLTGLAPFLSFSFLEADSKDRPSFASALASELVDLSLKPGPLREFLLGFFCGHLGYADVSNVAKRVWVLGALKQVLMSVLALEDEQTEPRVRKIAGIAVDFCAELQRGCGVVCRQGLQLLRVIARRHNAAVLPYLLTLAGLASESAEGHLYYEVMATAMKDDCQTREQPPEGQAAIRGLLTQPLVQCLALQAGLKPRAWAGHVFNLLLAPGCQPLEQETEAGGGGNFTSYNDIGPILLSSFQGFNGESAALAWLKTCSQLLQSCKPGEYGSKDTVLDAGTWMLLGTLLLNESTKVQLQALETLLGVAKAYPLMGVTFLPILVHRLQTPPKLTRAGEGAGDSPQIRLAILETIPQLATHAACVPLCLRFLKPLAARENPEVLRAVALRLDTLLWLTSRRNFGRLQACLLGFAAPLEEPGVLLRAARAACVRQVCQADPGRGTELVAGIQEMLADDNEAIAALALDCLCLLCEADALDFYGAWPVVRAILPGLPRSRPQVARHWVRLLALGALDAKAAPEQAKAVVNLLWRAAKDKSPLIRGEAYKALSSFSLADLELLEALPPLQDYTRLLLDENDDSARPQCSLLVQHALAFEHSIRRRYIAGKSKAPSGAPHQSNTSLQLTRKLTRDIPKQLLLNSSASGVELLLLSAPTPGQKPAERSDIAREAYAAFATKALKSPFCSALNGHYSLLIQTWRSFVARWLAAYASSQDNSRAHAFKAIFEHLLPAVLDEQNQPENAMLAAGVLCSLQKDHSSSSAEQLVPILLSRLAKESSTATSTACALAIGLAAKALHPADLAGRQEVAARLLDLLADEARADVVRGAAAEALGHLIIGVEAEIEDEELGQISQPRVDLLHHLLQNLLVFLSSACPEVFGSLQQAASGMRPGQAALLGSAARGSSRGGAELLGLCSGLANGISALARLNPDAVIQIAQTLSKCQIQKYTATQQQALCNLLPSLFKAAADLLKEKEQTTELAERCKQTLRAVLEEGSHGAAKGAAAASLGHLLSLTVEDASELQQKWLPILTAPLAEAQKLSGSAALVTGVGSSLAVLLGGAGLLPGVGRSSPLELSTESAAEALTAISKVLEALVESSAFARAKQHLQWVLAAVCSSRRARPAKQPAEGPGKSLAGLPEGAMQELAAFVLSCTRGGDSDEQAVVKDAEKLHCALTCLSAAPRLPKLQWGRVCRSLAEAAARTEHEGLWRATVQLAIDHGRLPSAGLGEFLDDLTQPSSFDTLPIALQTMLLRQLPDLAAAVSASRRNLLLESLTSLTKSAGAEVIAAAWNGLEACLLQPEEGILRAGLLAAAAHLFAALPPPPNLLFGERLLDRPENAEQEEQGAGMNNLERLLWSAALSCLQAMSPSERQALLEQSNHRSAAVSFARIWLFNEGALPAESLEKCRNTCVEAEAAAGDHLMLQLAFACSRLPVAKQQQLLLVTLDAMQICKQPLQALKVAALLVASASAAAGKVPVDALLSAFSAETAVRALPLGVSSLLRRHEWAQASAQILQRFGDLLDSPFRTTAAACLRAARDLLPSSLLHFLAKSAAEARLA